MSRPSRSAGTPSTSTACTPVARPPRLVVGGVVGDGRRVHQHQVRAVAGRDRPAVVQPEPSRRGGRQVLRGGRPVPVAELAHVPAEEPRERPPAARVRVAAAVDAVGAGAVRGVAQQGPHRLVRVGRRLLEHAADLQVRRDEQVERRVGRRHPEPCGDVEERQPLGPRRTRDPRQRDARPDLVARGEPGPDRRVGQERERAVGVGQREPVRQGGEREDRRAPQVRVRVEREVQPLGQGVVDQRPEARRRGRGSARRGCRRRSRGPGRAAPRARPEPGPRSRACGTRAAGGGAPAPRTARRAPRGRADDAGAYSSPVDIPRAPSSSPCSSSRTIAATSSGRAGRSSAPMTAYRRVPCGTRYAVCTVVARS